MFFGQNNNGCCTDKLYTDTRVLRQAAISSCIVMLLNGGLADKTSFSMR